MGIHQPERMIEYQLTGRCKDKKRVDKFVGDVFYHYFKNRMKRTVLVDVKFVTELGKGKIAGYCHGDKNEVQIDIARTENGEPYTTRDICLNLAHELVHAKQFIRGEKSSLIYVYSERPHEVEAYKMEEHLVTEYYDN